MRGALSCRALDAAIAKFQRVDIVEQMFAGAHEDGRKGEMHFIDEPGVKILADGGHAAAEADVLAVGGVDGAPKGGRKPNHDRSSFGAGGHNQRSHKPRGGKPGNGKPAGQKSQRPAR